LVGAGNSLDSQQLKLELVERAVELELLIALDRLTLLLELTLTALAEAELLLKLLALLWLLLKEIDSARDPWHELCRRPAPATWLSSSALSWRIFASPFHLIGSAVTCATYHARQARPSPNGNCRFCAPSLVDASTLALLRYREPRPPEDACQPQHK
jgi:hypothetical protein